MSVRTAMRYVMHRITEHPDTGVTFEAECLHCGGKSTPAGDSAPVDTACLSHTGRSGHAGFRRTRTSFAMVVRAE
ncbi:hypothetical protein ACIPSJ_28510 [Streptomyces sp. NPDC090088]|uniref:DUF7848 domain-containing protein n=1 Tax=Streptomyces sp. NPDC090088 TaxID=3365944 RepID=UPI00381CCD15